MVMTMATSTRTTPLGPWALRFALFAAQLIVIALIAHRLGSMRTPLAMGLVFFAFVTALVSLGLGMAGATVIWRRGAAGAWHATTGIIVALAILAWPAAVAVLAWRTIQLPDVSTDTELPPDYEAIARERGPGTNPVAYGGAEFAARQLAAYPTLNSRVVPRSYQEVFDAAGEAARRMKWRIVAEEPPGEDGGAGHIEATDKTLVLGFTDDIVIRIAGDEREAVVDVRSSSRFGRFDFGRNAQRVRDYLKELQARIDASVVASPAGRSGVVPTQGSSGPATSVRPRNGRDREPPDARRAPQRKATPPSRGEDRARDRRSRRSPE